ncbi:MAG: hypothetical protein KJ077_39085 [Anaerolineae bacterium]|nr:hypothetical protein [Anaerolineae bacterium]
MPQESKPLFTILNTPVTAEPSALLTPLSMVALGWISSSRSWPNRLYRGGWLLLAYALTDLLHFVGHILSARYAGAPMDRIHLAAPLPRTIYLDNVVTPQAHRLRSFGGPLANTLAGVLFFGLGFLAPSRSAVRTGLILLGWFNSLLAAGSLFPLPFIDGGVILKWTLVERGQSSEQADRVVRQAGFAAGSLVILFGLWLIKARRWR